MTTGIERPTDELTVAEAARIAGLAMTTIRLYCRRGELPHRRSRFGGGWAAFVIVRQDLEDWIERGRRPRGRPRVRGME